MVTVALTNEDKCETCGQFWRKYKIYYIIFLFFFKKWSFSTAQCLGITAGAWQKQDNIANPNPDFAVFFHLFNSGYLLFFVVWLFFFFVLLLLFFSVQQCIYSQPIKITENDFSTDTMWVRVSFPGGLSWYYSRWHTGEVMALSD